MDRLYQLAWEKNIEIDYYSMKKLTAFSMPNAIIINPKKIKTQQQTKECLAHELGHHMKNAFYNISSTFETRERQEERATRWAVEELVPADDLKAAFDEGYTEIWQLAEYFDVSEDFMRDVIRVHTVKGNI